MLCVTYVFRYAESLRNSFPDDGKRLLFMQMTYQLLLHGQYPFKSKRMIVRGPPNSGKTTWFAPIQGVIDPSYIASITREGKFAMQTINEDTQVVFVDEWAPGRYN